MALISLQDAARTALAVVLAGLAPASVCAETSVQPQPAPAGHDTNYVQDAEADSDVDLTTAPSNPTPSPAIHRQASHNPAPPALPTPLLSRAYLPVTGPLGLRFAPIITNMYELPPLAMADVRPAPQNPHPEPAHDSDTTSQENDYREEFALAPTVPVAASPDTGSETITASSPLPAPTFINSTNDSQMYSPQVWAEFFQPGSGGSGNHAGTNGYDASIAMPLNVGFMPPYAPPREPSQATYQVK